MYSSALKILAGFTSMLPKNANTIANYVYGTLSFQNESDPKKIYRIKELGNKLTENVSKYIYSYYQIQICFNFGIDYTLCIVSVVTFCLVLLVVCPLTILHVVGSFFIVLAQFKNKKQIKKENILSQDSFNQLQLHIQIQT